MARKTFNQKLNTPGDLPKLEPMTDPRQIRRYGPGVMLVAPPITYDEQMRRVPEGKLTTSDRIRAHLAREAGADVTCPLTAGLFINIAANASEERMGANPTPYWRTLKADGELNPKYPGGLEAQRLRLQTEGHRTVQRGKRMFIENYEASLFDLEH